MTNTEISRRLALAIGYAPHNVRVDDDGAVWVHRADEFGWCWMPFDHRDERTIFIIAARYNAFPRLRNGKWYVSVRKGVNGVDAEHDCPATCIALATIEAKERGLLS